MDTADYYAKASYDILRNIARGLSRADEKSQMRRLLAIARIKKENIAILNKAVRNIGVQLKKDIAAEIHEEIGKLGEEWPEKYQNRMILQPLQALERQIWQKTASRLNAVNTVMRLSADKMTDDAFEWLNEERYRALSTGTAEIATGALSLQDAMEITIRRLAESDLTGFEDKAGRKWTPEAYVAMDLQTTLHNAKNETARMIGEQVGANVYYVTTHADSRPGCDPYQGRYFSTDGTYGTIRDIHGGEHEYEPEENTTLGDPDGLFGINCKHDRIPVLDGLFRDRSKEEQPSDPEGYQATQRARGMERRIRAMARERGVLLAGGSYEDARRIQNGIDEKTEVYYRYCRQNGLRERDDRLAVY